MKNVLLKTSLVALVIVGVTLFAFKAIAPKPKVLIFSKTAGFHHNSIAPGNIALLKLASENGIDTDTTTDSNKFTDDNLKNYSTVIFLNTTGNLFNNYQEAALERYIQAGGGYVGIHAATDAEYDWGWYGRLVGGYFDSHPKTQEAELKVIDRKHISTKHLPKKWKRTDEWYNFKKLNKDVKVLITIDEKSYEGGKNGDVHPMAWYHEYDGGRAFYTEFGHTNESFSDPLYLQHVLGGIQYAIGENKPLDYSKAKTQNVPEADRFIKTVLADGVFNEPTEMTILPDLNILVVQRRGEIMHYNQSTGNVKQVGFLNVYHKAGVPKVNAEEGILGVAADPDFKKNNFVYIFYSPADTSVNRLSRFVFKNDSIHLKSEKVVLQFYSQRNICCHTGGSVAFGPEKMLYVSTGDNSTPFNEIGQKYVNQGYAPLDDRPGHLQYDARRTAGNTNDLRGKVLRIKLKEDGSYEIPAGNLFPPNTAKTRPEIYTMGHRNPYRISVDQKNGNLYWGDVGPDSRADSLDTRGPKGYDEVNQARKPGYYGWPLFIGNNISYRRYDYETGKSGETFDPSKPLNESRNNTGLTQLPPAEPANIWYAYVDSKEFPQMGSGGRTAMAGPVYYTDLYSKETRYPEYYNGKFFMYEWARNFIKVVTMRPNGDFDKMEPFMEGVALSAPMDMEVGPDGRIYVLEYGKGWFKQNPEAGIARIDYLSGNRPPKVSNLTIDKTNGNLPFNLTAKVTATDPENDNLTYRWKIGTEIKETSTPNLQYTISKAGDYNVQVEVADQQKAVSKSNTVEVYAGNAEPEVNISVEGNQTFYFTGKPVKYKIAVKDEGDKFDPKNLYVSMDYIEGKDLAGASLGHQVISEAIQGKNLMAGSDCSACHKVNETSIGPSFTKVAEKYKEDRNASQYLVSKIIKGGSGVWGENTMPAHANMSERDARQIVSWIESLALNENMKASMPATGTIVPEVKTQEKENTVLKIFATYTDKGAPGIKALASSNTFFLRSNEMDASVLTETKGFVNKDSVGGQYIVFTGNESSIKIKSVDLAGIKTIALEGFGNGKPVNYEIQVKANNLQGQVLGKGEIQFGTGKDKTIGKIELKEETGGKLLDLYIVCKPVQGPGKAYLKTLKFISEASSE